MMEPGGGQLIQPVKFKTAVIDPPWSFDNKASRATADNHYETIPTRHLYRFPIEDWMADDSSMWLWTTAAHLESALDLMKKWGFVYKQNVVWVKVNNEKVQLGLGNYMRHAHELCLFGTKGKPKILRHDVPSVFWAPRQEHSKKPECFQDMIETFVEGPYLECFGRRQRPNWTVWGNQA